MPREALMGRLLDARRHRCVMIQGQAGSGKTSTLMAWRKAMISLGYDVCCFIGIILKSAKDYPSALAKLNALDEVTEAYYTTGHYSIFIKVMCRSIDALQQVLINKIQTIDEIQSTETLISLQNPIMRTIRP